MTDDSTSRHTPGPWKVEGRPNLEHVQTRYWEILSGSHEIATVWTDAVTANLIAAAPEMLDSLREIVALDCDAAVHPAFVAAAALLDRIDGGKSDV